MGPNYHPMKLAYDEDCAKLYEAAVVVPVVVVVLAVLVVL